MLYHLAHPAVLLGIFLAAVIGCYAHNWAQCLVAQALGDRMPRAAGVLSTSVTRLGTPYAVVCFLLAGYGWAGPVPMDERWRARRGKLAVALAAGPVTYAVLALLGALLVRLQVGSAAAASSFGIDMSIWLLRTWSAMFILSLVPVPPLDGGRIMLALAPTSTGWQRTRYHLEERNIGLAIAMGVVLLPLLFPTLPSIVDQLANPLARRLLSLFGVVAL